MDEATFVALCQALPEDTAVHGRHVATLLMLVAKNIRMRTQQGGAL